jgi:hypothetical protein
VSPKLVTAVVLCNAPNAQMGVTPPGAVSTVAVPHVFVAALIDRSHPSAVEPSQLAKPAAHAPMPHPLPVQVALAWGGVVHTVPHALQFDVVVVSVSHPSATPPLQSPKPVLHDAMAQAPVEHVAVAFAGAHATPHPPQSVVVVVGVSHPVE